MGSKLEETKENMAYSYKDYKKEIINEINKLSGSRSFYDVFYDWIECMAISIQNSLTIYGGKRTMEIKQQREEEYSRIVAQYENAEEVFGNMMGMLVSAMEYCITDMLGEIYMESEIGNKRTGQFFSPASVGKLCAHLAIGDQDPDSLEPITVHEPSCGSGGMIIEAAEKLQEQGINYQRRMKVIAQDLDWKAVYMCYVQLSLYGIDAIVAQGDTLTDPYTDGYPEERVWHTPRNMGALI